MFRRPLLILIAAATAITTLGQTVPDTTTDDPERRPILSRVTGIFNDLPQLDIPGTVKLTVRPHFGDLIHRDYIRSEVGFGWALNENFEINTDGSLYLTHGLGHSNDTGNGVGKARLGSRYVIEDWPVRSYDTSLAVNMETPTGHPPIDMTDGNRHLTPNFIVQHGWARNRRMSTYAGFGFDFMEPTSIPGTFGTNQPHEDSVNGTIGAIYDLGQLKYTLSATYATTAWVGDDTRNFFYLQPGLQWYIPSRFTFHSKTQWIAGLSVLTSWGPDGFNVSVGTRLRAEITFRQVMDKIRWKPKPKDENAP